MLPLYFGFFEKFRIVSKRSYRIHEPLRIPPPYNWVFKNRPVVVRSALKVSETSFLTCDWSLSGRAMGAKPRGHKFDPSYLQCDAIRYEQLKNLHFSRGYNF